MKKTAVVSVLALIATLVLSSCDAMFNANLFKKLNLGQVNLDNISSPAEIAQAASSPQFYVLLADDPAAKQKMLNTLQDHPTNDNLVLAAAIMIKTTEAGTIVDNLAGQLPSLATSTVTTADITNMLSQTLGSVINDQAAFNEAINALLAASVNLTTVATSVGLGGTLPAIAGSTPQDTAYFGIVALAVASLTPVSGTTADALFAIVHGADPAVLLNPIDTSVFDVDPLSGSTLSILLSAAGIDLSGLGTP